MEGRWNPPLSVLQRDKKSSAYRVKKRRTKKLRSIKKGYLDAEKEKEGGESYVCGGF